MNKKTTFIIAILATGFLVIGTGRAYAATSTTATSSNPFSQLVEMIVQKFGLDKTQVKTVVDQYRTQKNQMRQQKMQDRETSRLDKLVSDGKITADQKAAILKELETLKAKYSPAHMKNLSEDEREKKMQEMRDELKAWAKSQNINETYVMPGFGQKMGGIHRGDDPNGRWNDDDTSTP